MCISKDVLVGITQIWTLAKIRSILFKIRIILNYIWHRSNSSKLRTCFQSTEGTGKIYPSADFRFDSNLLRFKKCSTTSNYCWWRVKRRYSDIIAKHRVAFKCCFTLLDSWWPSIRKATFVLQSGGKGSNIYYSQQNSSHFFRFPQRGELVYCRRL